MITAASLRLFPMPRDVATAFVAIPTDPCRRRPAGAALRERTATTIGSFELLPRVAVELAARVGGVVAPLGFRSPFALCSLPELVPVSAPTRTPCWGELAAALDAGLMVVATPSNSERSERGVLAAARIDSRGADPRGAA